MSTAMLVERIEQLPPRERQIVEELVDALSSKKEETKAPKHFSFSWAGALREFRDQYTSVELQKKASEWRLES